MRIDELFPGRSEPYKYFRATRTEKSWKWAFQTDSKVLYTVVVEMNKPGLAEIGFSAKAPGAEKFTTAATGTGDAMRIKRTLLSIIQEFINDYVAKFQKPPRIISFAGDTSEPSRIKLYNTLAANPKSWLPKIDYDYKLHRTAEKQGYKYWMLVRTDLLD